MKEETVSIQRGSGALGQQGLWVSRGSGSSAPLPAPVCGRLGRVPGGAGRADEDDKDDKECLGLSSRS